MRDDRYITSKRDIRNKRYRQRRRQVILNRFIFTGVVLIIVLLCLILGIKACRDNESESNNPAENESVQSSGEKKDKENDTENGTDKAENNTEEQTTLNHVQDGERIVCIDPGHGGIDTGSEGIDGITEKEDNLKMAKALKRELESLGVTVYMTRDDDSAMDLEARVAAAESVNADLLISIHRNSYEGTENVSGFETWVHSSMPEDSVDVAKRLQAALVQAGITRDRGVKGGSQSAEGENYYINSHSTRPSCLLEMGFMTSAEDNRIFRGNTDALAGAMAQAIVDWMDAQGL